tara:strand:+ start:447 stop:611 length:165 start_codon:yes stop_codon:yes gene_type:complete
MAESVVDGPPLPIGEHLIRRDNLLELLFRLCVARVGVGVQFPGPSPVGPFDLVG